MTQSLILDPILACLIQTWILKFFCQALPLLVIRDCSKLSPYVIQRKTNVPNLKKCKKLILALNLVCFDSNLVPKNIFCGFQLFQTLIIVASYYCTHFQGKIMNHTREDGRTPSFGPNFGQNLVPKKSFCRHYLYYIL